MSIISSSDDCRNIQSQLAKLKAAVVESENKYLSLYNSNHLVILLIEPDTGNIFDANSAACSYYGYSKAEITAKTIFEINLLSKDEILNEMALAVGEKRHCFNFTHKMANGEKRNVEVFSGPINITGRQLLYSIVHDITDKLRMERALKESEHHYQCLLETAPYAVLVCSEYKVVFANPKVAQLLEAEKPADLEGIDILSLFSGEYRDLARKRIKRVLVNHSSSTLSEYELLTLKGTYIQVEAASAFFEYQGRPVVQIVLIDITERKKELERAARIQKQRLVTEFPIKDKGKLEVIYKPASFISGDLFHFYRVNDHYVMGLLGDVMGKGIGAALCNSALKVLFYDIASRIHDPVEALEELNRGIPGYLEEDYVAACCFSFDFLNKTCKFVAAGINSCSLKLGGRYYLEESIKGPFLGMFETSVFESKLIKFNQGDIFYFYTDGMESLLEQNRIRSKFTSFSTSKEQRNFLENKILDNQAVTDDITWLAIEIL